MNERMNVIFFDQSKVFLHLELEVSSPFPVAFLVVCLFPPFSLLIFPAQSSVLPEVDGTSSFTNLTAG